MIDKDKALLNLARASLDSSVAWTIYLETLGADHENRVAHTRAETKYNTLSWAYVECGVVTWEDINDSWFFKTKIVTPKET